MKLICDAKGCDKKDTVAKIKNCWRLYNELHTRLSYGAWHLK